MSFNPLDQIMQDQSISMLIHVIEQNVPANLLDPKVVDARYDAALKELHYLHPVLQLMLRTDPVCLIMEKTRQTVNLKTGERTTV